MPILVTSSSELSREWISVVRMPGIPDFNRDVDTVVADVSGWFSRPVGQPVLVANGGGAGAALVPQSPVEELFTVRGAVRVPDAIQVRTSARMVGQAFSDHEERPLVVEEPDGSARQIFAALYDKPDITIQGPVLRFSLPLVAPDPYKYAMEPLIGTMGVFSGVDWFREYADDGAGGWERAYALEEGRWVRTYEQVGETGPYPTSLGLDSDGDATSRRMTIEVVGPLPAGWWVENTDTGERLWASLGLTAGQALVLDCRHRLATLNGADVSHLVFGDYLTFEAGSNTYRLVATEDQGGYATVTALPAYL